ncbi:hypothetical protein [Salinisphaera sp. LB1]|nr:hypothetical protein [Salinisphaera sp. LB1]AWN17362.1 hypothetical protein SALB1_3168 [Salinisphaera sp. LB1]
MSDSKDRVIDDIFDQDESHLHFLHLTREVPGDSALPDAPDPAKH